MSEGISCWPYGDRDYCDRTIESGRLEGRETFMSRAGREGWVIGHWDGQAYYCCPEHHHGVWDPVRLEGYSRRQPYTTRLHITQVSQRYRWSARGKGGYRPYSHVSLAGANFRLLLARHRKTWAELRADRRAKERR